MNLARQNHVEEKQKQHKQYMGWRAKQNKEKSKKREDCCYERSF
jgi:hypothetical protein